MNHHEHESLITDGDQLEAGLVQPENPSVAVDSPAEFAYSELQYTFGNALVAASASSGSPPDPTQTPRLHHTFGNAAVARTLIQRKAGDGPSTANATPSSGESQGAGAAGAVPSRTLIVEDTSESVQPEQMKKTEFLAQLRSALRNAAAGTPGSAAAGPQLDTAFNQYSTQSSAQLERTIRTQVPEASGATSATALIQVIVSRASRSLAAQMPSAGGGMLAAAGSAVSRVSSGIASAASGVVAGVGSAISGLGSILFKERDDRPRRDDDPASVQSQLGGGHSLESGVKSRMESAYGQSFNGVEVHTDANAGGLSDNLSARAFTVGQHIAFGAGEYQPGTLIGDALIAHELAHVVQQRGGAAPAGPAQKSEAPNEGLEDDADHAAVGAVVSGWHGAKGLARVAASALPKLKSGLRLQRCSDDRPAEQAFLPMTADEVEALSRMRQNIAAAEELLKDPNLAEEDADAIRAAVQSARGTLASYQDIREQGSARSSAMAPIAIASTAIVADDATGVGVADDPLLIVTGLAAIVTLIVTKPPAQDDAIGRQWLNVGSSIDALGTTITIVLMAQKVGEQVRGLADVLAVHLARLLGETVGGKPPDEPNDPNNFKHWWKEIKAFLKGIKDKGLTPRQLLRELRKKFSEEQIESIKQAIRRAAEKMGEDPPEFL